MKTMENTNKTIAQLLEITEFPFILENKAEKGKVTYYEYFDNSWSKYKYDLNNNEIYFEKFNGYWAKYEYDLNNNLIYKEDSKGYWIKYKYDDKNNCIYEEDLIDGILFDKKINKTI